MKTRERDSDNGIVIESLSAESGDTLLHTLNERESGLARIRALERIAPFRSHMKIVMEGEPGAGKRFHAALFHEQTPSAAEFVEVTSESSVETLRAILFDGDRKLIEEMIGNRLPSLQGRSLLYVHDIGEFSIIQQTLLSRFIIQQGQQSQSHTRVVIATRIPWSDLTRKRVLIDSFLQCTQSFEVCRIPPLRDRLDEVPSLVQGFLRELRRRERVDCWRIKEETLEQLKTRQWHDNVRELKYLVESAATDSSDGTMTLPGGVLDEVDRVWEAVRTIQAGKRLAIEQSLVALEKSMIERALVRYNFDLRKTARMLVMTEANLTYRIKKFSIYIPAPL